MPNRFVQRHIRQYASSVGLNSDDEEHGNVTSYSTRVERVEKLPGTKCWTLTLRKMEVMPYSKGKIRADWWTEEFDAVVVAALSESDSPWVPPIPGLKEWAEAHPNRIFHGREYRRPEEMRGKVKQSI
jgi:cation diffusion facilitator CzcD-associated flavoprotein CzcO